MKVDGLFPAVVFPNIFFTAVLTAAVCHHAGSNPVFSCHVGCRYLHVQNTVIVACVTNHATSICLTITFAGFYKETRAVSKETIVTL